MALKKLCRDHQLCNEQAKGGFFIYKVNTLIIVGIYLLHCTVLAAFAPPNSCHFQNSLQALTKVGGEDKENGWFSSVTSFFSKTLYW